MKRTSLPGILVLLIMGICWVNMPSAEGVPLISKEELRGKLGSPNVILIDVRVESDWKESKKKIAGAVRENPEEVDLWAASLPKDKEIVLYCA